MPDFGPRIRPEEINFSIRCRLSRRVYRREFLTLAAVFVPCMLLTLLITVYFRHEHEGLAQEWPILAPMIITAAAILVMIHVWSIRERHFIERAVAAAAEVKEIDCSGNWSNHHRLILRYRPMQHNGTGPNLRGSLSSNLVFVSVESDLPGFTTELQPGDSLSILYDPAEPDHVCLVEEEHPAAA